MRARSFLYENDNRTLIDKLKDLINHPSTLDTIKQVATEKLNKLLREKETGAEIIVVDVPSVNLGENDLDRIFSYSRGNTTCRQIYNSLRQLKPMPSDVVFLKQGQIHLFVPPPFLGLTKIQYTKLLCDAIPGVKQLSAKYIEDKGYHFIITLI